MLIQFNTIKACDVCGCSIGNGSSSILPQFQKNFIGWRTSFSRYQSGAHHETGLSKEATYTNELWGRFYLHKKWQLIATLPYQIKSKTETSTDRIKGIGDATAIINYTLFNHTKDSSKWKQLVLIGGGLKIPTGQFNTKKNDAILPQGLQAGSGSLDYLFNIIHTIRRDRLGLNSNLQYKINGTNSNQYRFGNQLSFGSRLFYWKKTGPSSTLLPTFGVLYDQLNKDLKNNFTQTETGGYQSSITLGLDFYWKKWLFAVNLQKPFKQNLNNNQTQALTKFQFNTLYLF